MMGGIGIGITDLNWWGTKDEPMQGGDLFLFQDDNTFVFQDDNNFIFQ